MSSRYDSWFNQVFVNAALDPLEASHLLEGRPGFVWLREKPTADEQRELTDRGFEIDTSYAMTGSIDASGYLPNERSWLVETDEQLNSWHAIYSQIYQADPRGLPEWRTVYKGLGPTGRSTLLLLLGGIRQDDPKAIGAVFLSDAQAGLYCFGTLPEYRQKGFASDLVEYSHLLAREHGASRSVLEATAMGRPVYRRCGYEDVAPVYSIVSPDRLDEMLTD
jgi:GNAT superfamily N-acetyltransferase